MNTSHAPIRARRLAALASVLMLAFVADAAHAALVTWYVEGNFDDINCGTKLEAPLAKAYPSGTSFAGSYSFETTAPPIFITEGRYDFTTLANQGGQTLVVTAKHTLTAPASEMITETYVDGGGFTYQTLTLNSHVRASGAHSARYGDPAVDLVVMSRKSTSQDWFVYGFEPASVPDLASANNGMPCMDLSYFDSRTGTTYHRFGNVTSLSDQAPSDGAR